MKKIKLVLAGTGEFSKTIFESLILDERFEIIAVISQPNKEYDRKKNLILTPVAKLANQYSLKLYQPNKIKEIYDELAASDFDFFMTAAFGQLIPSNILELPKKLPLNVHGSILEKYRGAAPIQHALLNGDKKTGITLIEMVDKMDAGDILKEFSIEIDEADTALELFEKLGKQTAKVIGNWLVDIFNGNYQRRVQKEELVTFAKKIKNEDAELFETLTKKEALNKIRAFNDQPGAFILYNQKRLKIFRATDKKIKSPLKIKFQDGFLYLIEYQFEGKKKVIHEI
ncbi:Methionyl-tRNA formyltransferase [Metamycoplasma alkalescens 14918]|uniref:methionyl-tRNA formyltransferase n=1 Tax=Metamycoplasma alkalescens 14918 TaxID=1188234 RepID=N9U0E6_9BACT|nr:methionyl-tRNA formyltransferase [Metamycoplasma alkalescens]ENY54027.1 Methionyl-tRNA formyltransferase [Metamycoplasma alkalescens 14918]